MGFFNWWKTLSGYNNAFNSTSPPELGSINLIKDKKKLIIYHKQLNFVERKPQYLIVDKMVDRKTAWLPIENKAQNNLKWIVGKNTTVYKTICIFKYNSDTGTYEETDRDPKYKNVNITVRVAKQLYYFDFPSDYVGTPLSPTEDGRYFIKTCEKSAVVKIGICVYDAVVNGSALICKTATGYGFRVLTSFAITQSGNKIYNGDTIEWNYKVPDELKQFPIAYINYINARTKRKYYIYYKNNRSIKTACSALGFKWRDGTPFKNHSMSYNRRWQRIPVQTTGGTYLNELDELLSDDGRFYGRWGDYNPSYNTSRLVCGTLRRFIRSTDDLENTSHSYVVKKQLRISYIDFKIARREYNSITPIEDKYCYHFRYWFRYNKKTNRMSRYIEIK